MKKSKSRVIGIVIVILAVGAVFLIHSGKIKLPGGVDTEQMKAMEGEYHLAEQDGMSLKLADGKATIRVGGSYQLKESADGIVAALKPTDSSEFIDYSISTENGTTKLTYQNNADYNLSYEEGTDGLNSDSTEAFEGTYRNVDAKEGQFIFHEDGTYEGVIEQEYSIDKKGAFTMTGSQGSTKYQCDYEEDSFTLSNDDGEAIVTWIK